MKSNQSEQMAKRLKSELQALAPELTCTILDSEVTVFDGATVIALIKLARRTFDGFNIAYELSSEVGQGFPEHDCWFAVKSDITRSRFARVSKAVFAVGCSEVKLIETSASPAESDLADANVVVVIPNDGRIGSIGA